MTFLLYLIYAVLILGPIYLLFLWWKIAENKRHNEWLANQEYETLVIEVPRNNEKAPLAAEQMFASLHGIYSDSSAYQNHLSFEIVSVDKFVQFYIHIPKHLVDFVEGQIYAQYPTVEINHVVDYSAEAKIAGRFFAGCELKTTKSEVYPIKLFTDFEVDPLSGITSVMSKILPGEEMWLQIIIRPVGDEWQERGISVINQVKSGGSKGLSFKELPKKFTSSLAEFGRNFVKLAVNPGAELGGAEAKEVKLSGLQEDALKSIEYKVMKLGFETKIRLMAIAENPTSARSKIEGLAAAFKQFNTTHANGFKHSSIVINDENFLSDYISRDFQSVGYILNISELAAIYHLPHQTVETPHIVWAGSKKAEPPSNLPMVDTVEAKQITILGETNFRNVYRKFGIKLDDRRRHIYMVGKSGVGKSVLMENMAMDDIREGRGVIIVDPHGELADKVLNCIPDERINDVAVFDPADRAYPIAFNLLEKVEDDFKGMVASGFVGIFKKIFGESWGPRLEHILRNTVLALLDFPDSTMLDIPRMLTEKRFREKVVSFVVDPVIKEFWNTEFAQYDNKFRTEAVSPILNKVGQFLSTATIRNIVGQPHSRINIREIMDTEKILLLNLSRGKIGEDNSALLGAMLITKIQLSAISRADVTIDQRPDSYLYVDEFQNFATESFSVILSEARKYNLNLTVANQYISQMPEIVRDAVFGNAGTIIAFRVGGIDADFLVKEFEPVFEGNDLVNLDKYHIYIKLLIDGITKPAFSARTLPPVAQISGNRDRIVALSRQKHSQDRVVVENMIIEKSKELEYELKAEAESFFAAKSGNNSSSVLPKIIKPEEKKETGESQPEKIVKKEVEKPKEEERKPRLLKWQNIIADKIYKEQTARGGVKWYVGTDIDPNLFEEQGISIDENGQKMIDLMEKVYGAKIRNPKSEIQNNVEKKSNEEIQNKSTLDSNIKKEDSDNSREKVVAEKPATKINDISDANENSMQEGVVVQLHGSDTRIKHG